MKVYNIEDTNRFFEVLSECSGDVEIVGKDGTMIPFNDEEVAKVLETTFADTTIQEMELKLNDPKDFVRVLSFLEGMKNAA